MVVRFPIRAPFRRTDRRSRLGLFFATASFLLVRHGKSCWQSSNRVGACLSPPRPAPRSDRNDPAGRLVRRRLLGHRCRHPEVRAQHRGRSRPARRSPAVAQCPLLHRSGLLLLAFLCPRPPRLGRLAPSLHSCRQRPLRPRNALVPSAHLEPDGPRPRAGIRCGPPARHGAGTRRTHSAAAVRLVLLLRPVSIAGQPSRMAHCRRGHRHAGRHGPMELPHPAPRPSWLPTGLRRRLVAVPRLRRHGLGPEPPFGRIRPLRRAAGEVRPTLVHRLGNPWRIGPVGRRHRLSLRPGRHRFWRRGFDGPAPPPRQGVGGTPPGALAPLGPLRRAHLAGFLCRGVCAAFHGHAPGNQPSPLCALLAGHGGMPARHRAVAQQAADAVFG